MDDSRKMALTKESFAVNTPMYPSMITEICKWFNDLTEYEQRMVQLIVQDAIQQHDNKGKTHA